MLYGYNYFVYKILTVLIRLPEFSFSQILNGLIDIIVHACDKSNATLERRTWFRVKKKESNFYLNRASKYSEWSRNVIDVDINKS